MTDRTLGLIYTIKNENGYSDIPINKFLMDYYNTDCPYSRHEIDQILRATCIDYIETADDPIKEIRRYFSGNVYSYVEIPEHDRMIQFLMLVLVKSNEKYINGFREMKGVNNG